jgi:hypothetical protein
MSTLGNKLLRFARWMVQGMAFLPAFSSAQVTPEAAPGAAVAGVWTGTVGTAQVQVCLSPSGAGQYYYLRHQRGIGLRVTERLAVPTNQDTATPVSDLRWIELEELAINSTRGEEKIAGRWRMRAVAPSRLAGTWTSAASGQDVEIRLRRLIEADNARSPSRDGNECHAMFFAPLTGAFKRQFVDINFEGQRYRTINTVHAAAFAVAPEVPHAKRLNAFTLDWLKQQAMFAYGCAMALGQPGEPLGSSLSPVAWTDKYLILEDNTPEVYCGGAHGGSSSSQVTWSLPRGKPVDTWTWFKSNGPALRFGASYDKPQSALRRLLEKREARDAYGDCVGAVDLMSLSAPFPSAKGMSFPTEYAHVVRACASRIELTWQEVMPYLSAAGKAAMVDWTK